MLTEAELLELTHHALPQWPAPSHLAAILKGGSDRRYYRVHFQDPAARGVILMTYTLARPDNPRFVPATARLKELGIRVPEVFSHDAERLIVWLEDLGSVDLHAMRNAPWSTRAPLYESALAEVAKLHAVDAAALSADDLSEMELCFDETLYEWEQNYFLQHYYRGMLAREPDDASRTALAELRQHLASRPRGLVHRDFQSQNVLIRNDAAWLIDYQGVRPGLAEYDLASLLLDPYVNLTNAERESLLRWYAIYTHRDFDALQERYVLCAAQRLMQAIGAYANLSRNLNKPAFAQFIPIALERLRAVCAGHAMLQPLLPLTENPA